MAFLGYRQAVVCGLLLAWSMGAAAMQDTDAYSMERLREKFDIIRKSKGVYLNENILLNQLRKVGVDFDPSPADLESLKSAGASDNFLSVVKELGQAYAAEKAKTEAPPPPPKPKQGDLAVSCKPVDCDVFVDGQQRGSTKQGLLKIGPLPEGVVKVAVKRKDWDADRDAHTSYIKDGETDKVEFTLKESREALEAMGQKMFDAMLQALGNDAGLNEAVRVRASGARLLSVQEGKQQQWPLMAYFKKPDLAKFLVTTGGRQIQVAKTASGFTWERQPGAEGQPIQDALREIYDHQFTKVIDMLRKTEYKKVATKLVFDEGEDRTFRADGGADRDYLITLDAESCPREVKMVSTGLLSGLRILYADFVKVGTTRYPKETQVILPGAGKQGAGIQIEKVDLGTEAVKDKDLEGKRNWKPLGAR